MFRLVYDLIFKWKVTNNYKKCHSDRASKSDEESLKSITKYQLRITNKKTPIKETVIPVKAGIHIKNYD